MTPRPLRIACVTEKPDPSWVWLQDQVRWRRPLEWSFFRPGPRGPLDRLLGKPVVGRITEGLRLRRGARTGAFDLIVTHLPYIAAWMSDLVGDDAGGAKRLAFAFNFTDLPSGVQAARMKRAFARLDRFTVFSSMERDLYARHFGLPLDRIDLALWGANPPIENPEPRSIEGAYVAALGGEARDYATFVEAARQTPETAFVAITRPWSLEGVTLPANVRHFVNLPWSQAWSLVHHAAVAVVPLRDELAPNGMVTFVGGMHLGKAQVVTRSAGLSDYAIEGETALTVPPGDPRAMKAAIERLLAAPAVAAAIGARAKAFADQRCSEAATVAYFLDFLDRTFGDRPS